MDAALDRAEGDGYLNDSEYAAALVRRRTRGRGYALIAQELRAKGIGEAGAIVAPAAIVNAVIDALSPWGIVHLDMPLKREKVWQAIHNATAS